MSSVTDNSTSKSTESGWTVISESPRIEMLKQPEKKHVDATYLFRMPDSETFTNSFAIEWLKPHVSAGDDKKSKRLFRATDKEKHLFSLFLYKNWISAHKFLGIPSAESNLLIFQRLTNQHGEIMSALIDDPTKEDNIKTILEKEGGQIFQMHASSSIYQNFIEKVRASQKPNERDHTVTTAFFAHEIAHLQSNGRYFGYVQNTDELRLLTEIRSYMLNFLYPLMLRQKPANVYGYKGKIKTKFERFMENNSVINRAKGLLKKISIKQYLETRKEKAAVATADVLKNEQLRWRDIAKISDAMPGVDDIYALLIIAKEFSKVDKEFKTFFEQEKADSILYLLNPPTPEDAERLSRFAENFACKVAKMPLAKVLAKAQQAVKDVFGYSFVAKDVKPHSFSAPTEIQNIKNFFSTYLSSNTCNK